MKLEQYLTTRDQTPAAFAASIGVPASTITRIIRGERAPRLDTIAKITAATAGAVNVHDFIQPIGMSAGVAA